VQFDCPDSIETYIHRVGRTARCGGKGCSLLVLTPEETDALYFLHNANLPLREVKVRDGELHDISSKVMTEVMKGLKVEAQKAVISYLRSIHLTEHKLFQTLDTIDFVKFSQSFGLFTVPNLEQLKLGSRSLKNVSWETRNKLLAESRRAEEEHKALTDKKKLSKFERHRSAKHMQSQFDRMKSLNPLEEHGDDILEVVEEVTPTAPVHEIKYEDISNKAKRKFRGSENVDLSVSKYGLSKRTVFDE